MAIHYFHCTDGIDLVLDRAGRELRDPRDLHAQALATAGELMRQAPGYGEWRHWAVHVYDEFGEVAIVPFPAKPRAQRARRPARLGEDLSAA